MKKILAFIATGIILCFSSCSNNETKTDETKTDSTGMNSGDTSASVATPPAFTPFKVFMVQHHVKNFDAWKAGYMSHDSMRQAYGITHYVLGRGLEDSNSVIVFDKMDDEKKAKEFAGLPKLKEYMQKAGVTGMPSFSYSNVIRDDNSKIDQRERVMVSHKVKNFDVWLSEYDKEGKDTRAANGMLDRGLARGIADSNMVYIVFAITDMAKAKARIASPEIKKIMMDAGVAGPPKIYYYRLTD